MGTRTTLPATPSPLPRALNSTCPHLSHSRYFSLDPPHDAACATCHLGGNHRTYTCYGCHERQPGQIVAEHREEGIRDIEN